MQSFCPREVCTCQLNSSWCLSDQLFFKGKWQVAKLICGSRAKINKRYSENCTFPLISPSWKSSPREQTKRLLLQERRESGEMSHVSRLPCLRCLCTTYAKVTGTPLARRRPTSVRQDARCSLQAPASPTSATPSLHTWALNLCLIHPQGWEGILAALLWRREKYGKCSIRCQVSIGEKATVQERSFWR